MAKRRYVGVYNITMTSRITCVYREQWYVIITFDLDTVPDIHAIKVLEAGVQTSCPFQYKFSSCASVSVVRFMIVDVRESTNSPAQFLLHAAISVGRIDRLTDGAMT